MCTVEIMGIILALQWMEDSSQYKVTIATYSISTLTSIQSENSCRQDLLLEVSKIKYTDYTIRVWMFLSSGFLPTSESKEMKKQIFWPNKH